MYIKQKNIIFARHVLATRKQAANETIDEFLNELNKLSKNCEFETVTAEQYRQELVRDSFINGLQSNSIRERLLEYPSLTLDDASSTARSLDLAHRSSSSYVAQQTITWVIPARFDTPLWHMSTKSAQTIRQLKHMSY